MALRKDLHVLVVDDMSVSRQLLSQMLEQIGIQGVRTTSTAQAALADLVAHPADIVISDLHMPGGSGLDLLKSLRNDRRTANIRFVMISGDDNVEWVEEAQMLGLDRYLPKPFDLNRLLRCVESIAGRI